MPRRKEKKPRIERTDDWQMIKQRSLWPEQRTYELIRPVVLFSETPSERAQETHEVKRTLYRQVERFEEQGMGSLFTPTSKQREDLHRSVPTAIRLAVVELKTEFPFLHLREIADVCFVRYGRRPSHHTVQSILAEIRHFNERADAIHLMQKLPILLNVDSPRYGCTQRVSVSLALLSILKRVGKPSTRFSSAGLKKV